MLITSMSKVNYYKNILPTGPYECYLSRWLPGHKEVMFIHAHYSHLSEITAGGQKPSPKHQDKAKR